eukprot:5396645-Prymnesium_polylepis.2
MSSSFSSAVAERSLDVAPFAPAQQRSWPATDALVVREFPEKGRSLVATTAFHAGSPLLCEVALCSASLASAGDASSPWHVAAALAAVVLQRGHEERTHELEPRFGSDEAGVAALLEREGDERDEVESALEALELFALDESRTRRLLHTSTPAESGTRQPEQAPASPLRALIKSH